MPFSVVSKFIGSNRLVGQRVISSANLNVSNWSDNFNVDSVTAGVNNLWTAVTVGAGSVSYSQPDREFTMQAVTNLNDEVTLTSVFDSNVQAFTGYDLSTNSAVMSALFYDQNSDHDYALGEFEFGLYHDANNYWFIRTTAVSTEQKLYYKSQDNGDGIEHESAVFNLLTDPTFGPTWAPFVIMYDLENIVINHATLGNLLTLKDTTGNLNPGAPAYFRFRIKRAINNAGGNKTVTIRGISVCGSSEVLG